jgi:plasmid stability protein
MTDVTLRDLSDPLYSELQRRAQQNGHTVEEEALDIVEQCLARERYARIADEEGLGSALRQIGRDFNITDEFENLREKQASNLPTRE